MLTHLVIRNFAIIEHLEIPFHDGFTVLTGETGAGKSIIIDALNLLLGGRASTEVIRTQEQEAVVEGVFELGEGMHDAIQGRLDARGMCQGEGELIVRRILSRTGRNKVFVNGSPTTVGVLAELMEGVVDISGQHEHYSLLDAQRHVEILDDYAELGPLREQMSVAWEEVSRVRCAIRHIRQDARSRVGRIDYLRFQLEEIDAARLNVGEEEELEGRVDRLRHAERLRQAGQVSLQLLEDGEVNVSSQLSEAMGVLARVRAWDEGIEGHCERLDELMIGIEELARDLRSHLLDLEEDPGQLDVMIERLDEVKRLKRKHGDSIEQILLHAQQMRQELEELEQAEQRSHHLGADLQLAEANAYKIAGRLSRARRQAAQLLEHCLEEELEDLNMARTQFVVRFFPAQVPGQEALEQAGARGPGEVGEDDGVPGESGRLELGPRGFDVVEFLISPNLGEEPKPLAKIASGGELSRVMLVMKSALLERDRVGTYVFDEVDTGIGGTTADRVGMKIQKAATKHQVLCITHLPQIASRAQSHYLVEKVVACGRTQSRIRPLEQAERIEEVARMLGGVRVTDTTIEAAREMIATIDGPKIRPMLQ